MKWKLELSTSHTPHSIYMLSYSHNISSMSVTVDVNVSFNTEHNFKSILILTMIHLKTFLDAWLGMHIKTQTEKFSTRHFFLSLSWCIHRLRINHVSLVFYEYTCFIYRPSLKPSVPGNAAYRRTEYGSGKSGRDTDIVFVDSKKESMGKINSILIIEPE